MNCSCHVDLKQILNYAYDEAMRSESKSVGPEHLFLGIIALNDTTVLNSFRKRGLTTSQIRALFRSASVEAKWSEMALQERFTGWIYMLYWSRFPIPQVSLRVWKVLKIALQKQKKLKHPKLSSDHIAFGLLTEKTIVSILHAAGIDATSLKESLDDYLIRMPVMPV